MKHPAPRPASRFPAKALLRALLIIATLCATPFIIAWALANANGDKR